MDFKEYLSTQKKFQLSALAEKMWPNNSMAKTYLSAKLNGLDNRTFTTSDEKKALRALKELGNDILDDYKKFKSNKNG